MALALTVVQATGARQGRVRSVSVACPSYVRATNYYRERSWYYQDRIFQPRHRSNFNPERVKSCKYALWVAKSWQHTARALRRTYENPPNYSAWLCIHKGEGAWNSNTGNGYYGGLQMDYGFMSSYGGHLLRTKGTADKWSPLEQVWVAIRAYGSGRGFNPWPNTARACGLL